MDLSGSFQPYNTNAPRATSLPAVLTFNTSFVLFAPSVRGDGAFEFLLLGRSNRNYTVEYTTDFNGWTNLTNVTLPGASATVVDPGAINAPSRFYHARLNPYVTGRGLSSPQQCTSDDAVQDSQDAPYETSYG